MTTTPDPEPYPLTLRSLISEWDLGLCPYNLRGREGADPEGICFQMGICANPNMPEPHCHTDHPQEGWPSERLLDVVSIADLDVPIADLLERHFHAGFGAGQEDVARNVREHGA